MQKRKFIAILLTAAMALALAVPALAIVGGAIEGEGDVQLPVLNVVVPTSLDFALDPLKIDANSPSQILSGNYSLINNTEGAAVLAAFYLDAELASGVKLGADLANGGANYELDATDKEIELGIIAAKTIATPTVYAASSTVVTFEKVGSDISSEIGFKLGKKDDSTDETAFSLYGVLNAYADWKKGDVNVEGIYVLRALSSLTTIDTVADTLGMVDTAKTTLPTKPDADDLETPGGVPTVAGFFGTSKGADEHTSAKMNISVGGTATTMDVKFFADGKTVSVKNAAGTVTYQSGTDYTYDSATNTLTILATRYATWKGLGTGTSLTAQVQLSGEATPYILNIEIVA